MPLSMLVYQMLSGGPAQLVEGDGPLNSFLVLKYISPQAILTCLMEIIGGTVLGDDAVFYFMHFFLECSLEHDPHLLKLKTIFTALILLQDPYTCNNGEEQRATHNC